MKRQFLGWHKPLLRLAADYLIDKHSIDGRLDLQSVTLVLPGRRAMMRIEEILASEAQKMDDPAWYPPELLTLESLPEKFYEMHKPVASEMTQWFAWIEAIQKLHETEPAALKHLLPKLPQTFSAKIAFGKMLAKYHYELAAQGIDFRKVAEHCESMGLLGEMSRWHTLSLLQDFYANGNPDTPGFLDRLGLWDLQAARLFAINHQTPEERERVVRRLTSENRMFYLVGLVDMNALQKQILKNYSSFLTALVFAPEKDTKIQSRFDEFGCLHADAWCEAPLEIEEDKIEIVWQPEQEADTLLRKIASLDGQFATGEMVVGVPDKQVVSFTQERLAQAGLPSRHIEGTPVRRTSVFRFLEALLKFARNPHVRNYAELLRHPDIEGYIRKNTPQAEDVQKDYLTQLDHYCNTFFPETVGEEWKADEKRGRKFEALPLVWQKLSELLPLSPTPPVRRQVCINSVIPAQAGIQTKDSQPVFLDSGFCRNDEKSKLVDGLPTPHSSLPMSSAPMSSARMDAGFWLMKIDTILEHLYAESLNAEPQYKERHTEQVSTVIDIVKRTTRMMRSLPEGILGALTFAEILELVLTQIESEPIAPPNIPNAIELIGWLDMAMDDAPVAIVTGMNDGIIPSFANSDIFLPDTLRRELGIMDNRRRCARDAYAVTVIQETRKNYGTVSFAAARRTTEGDAMLPSRFFFMSADTHRVAQRVYNFFADKKPESPVRLQRALRPGHEKTHRFRIPILPDLPEPIESFNVTELSGYLRCPYRYYLNRLRGLRRLDDAAEELPVWAFGSLIHEILQRFGAKGSPVRTSRSAKAIRQFLDAELARYSEQMFGNSPRATVAIQMERAKTRLHAFADWQADWHRLGYEIADVEYAPDGNHPVTLAGKALFGRIDRIDRHRNGEVVVIDYKTGTSDPKTVYNRKKREWSDFQLPLYHHILRQSGYAAADEAIRLAYLPISADTTELAPQWAEWTEEEIQSGISQAEGVIQQILATDWKTIRPAILPYNAQRWDDLAVICMAGLQQ